MTSVPAPMKPNTQWKGLKPTIAVALAATALLAGCGTGKPVALRDDWTAPTRLPASSPLATDRLSFNSNRTGNFELFVMDLDGANPVQLTNNPAYDSWSPRVSPNRRTILFNRTPAGVYDRDYAQVSLWAVAADGGRPVELRPVGLDGWLVSGHAEWAPDGKALVMFGGTNKGNPQIHITDALGQDPRPITDRPGQNLDPVFSPDGREIYFVGCPSAICFAKDYEIYRLDRATGAADRLTNDDYRDHDPMPSPDASQLAWLTNFGKTALGPWDVRVRDANGAVRRLANDSGITSRPQYTVDGAWIYMHRIAPKAKGFDVWRARPDGSKLTNVTADQPGLNEFPGP